MVLRPEVLRQTGIAARHLGEGAMEEGGEARKITHTFQDRLHRLDGDGGQVHTRDRLLGHHHGEEHKFQEREGDGAAVTVPEAVTAEAGVGQGAGPEAEGDMVGEGNIVG